MQNRHLYFLQYDFRIKTEEWGIKKTDLLSILIHAFFALILVVTAEFQVIMAAALSVAFGIILSIKNTGTHCRYFL